MANNTATVTTMVSPQIDLAIVKSASPNPVIAGATLSYTLTASDLGPSDATGVTITDTLPAGVTYLSAASGQGTVSQSGGTVTVTVGNLNAGTTATATILVTVNPSTRGSITNTAVVAGNEQETNTANNTASVTTQVDPLDDLSITKTTSADSVNVGALLDLHAHGLQRRTVGRHRRDHLRHAAGRPHLRLGRQQPGHDQPCRQHDHRQRRQPGRRRGRHGHHRGDGRFGNGAVTNTAKISGNEPETTLANNSASVTTFIVAWINPPQNVNPSKWYFLS